MSVDKRSACDNYVHHLCSNELYEGGELTERHCSIKCVNRRGGGDAGATQGSDSHAEEMRATITRAEASLKSAPRHVRWEWESFAKVGFKGSQSVFFEPHWTVYDGD